MKIYQIGFVCLLATLLSGCNTMETYQQYGTAGTTYTTAIDKLITVAEDTDMKVQTEQFLLEELRGRSQNDISHPFNNISLNNLKQKRKQLHDKLIALSLSAQTDQVKAITSLPKAQNDYNLINSQVQCLYKNLYDTQEFFEQDRKNYIALDPKKDPNALAKREEYKKRKDTMLEVLKAKDSNCGVSTIATNDVNYSDSKAETQYFIRFNQQLASTPAKYADWKSENQALKQYFILLTSLSTGTTVKDIETQLKSTGDALLTYHQKLLENAKKESQDSKNSALKAQVQGAQDFAKLVATLYLQHQIREIFKASKPIISEEFRLQSIVLKLEIEELNHQLLQDQQYQSYATVVTLLGEGLSNDKLDEWSDQIQKNAKTTVVITELSQATSAMDELRKKFDEINDNKFDESSFQLVLDQIQQIATIADELYQPINKKAKGA